MYPPFIGDIMLGNAVTSFIDGYMRARKPKRITSLNIDIEEIKEEIRDICRDKVCEYCGRTNGSFIKNCEGCGAPK